MRYLLIVVGAIVLLGVPALTHRLAKRRVDESIQRIASWEQIPDPVDRERCIFEYMRSRTRGDAMRWQLGTSLILGSLLFAAASLWVIYDVANESHQTAEAVAVQTDRVEELTADDCRLSRSFIQDEANDAVNDIRRLQGERDQLAEVITDTPDEVTQIPGYFDAPFWFREFLTDLLDQQIAEANQALGTMDTELLELRGRRDDLQDLLDGQHCPEP